jgi:hypothetical protein
MAGWPIMPLEEVGHAVKFAPWKRLYDEYVSKCTDKQRTPATMAQAFHKWAQWFATAFTEQERQRQEQELSQPGSMYAVRTFTTADVLSLTDSEFTRRYLAFCQVKIKDPSQVLQLLGTPKIDASSGGLTELMQAAQSFTDQLKLIPKAALQQCQAYQIRDSFIMSVFGSDQFRERKVDYLKCSTWHDVCDLMIRKASGPSGTAFTPFRSLKDLARKSTEKEKDKPSGKQSEDSADPAKPDMSLKTEQKWKSKFTDLASDHGIRSARHAFAPSWKIRYAYLLDSISQGGEKCVRCRRKKSHLPSSCDDPLAEVPYPTLSEDQVAFLRGLRLTTYDEDGNPVVAAQRPSMSGRTGKNEGQHSESRSSERNGQRQYPQAGANSERGDYGQDRRDRRSVSQERRTSEPNNCYRCDKPGHRANECAETKHADGSALQPRSGSTPRGQSPGRGNDGRNA